MKTIVRNLLLGAALVALVVVAAPALNACWGDDMAGFYVPDRMLVGSQVLEPGTYFVRVVHAVAGHNALIVTSPDGMKIFATVLATPHTLAPHEVQDRSRLQYVHNEEGTPSSLRTFLVANSSFGYDIYSRHAPAKLARGVTKELVAIAESR